MATLIAERLYTAEEYLTLEREAETKSEYDHGEIIPMPGASRKHNIIAICISAFLYMLFRKSSLEVYQSDMRVKVSDGGLYTYPDVVVADAPIFEDAEVDTLLNPIVIFEVLSKSTEQRDRGDKFEQYRTINSLTDYILVSQDRCRVEQFTRQSDDSWLYRAYLEQSDSIHVASIDCELSLEDIYEKIEFTEASPAKSQPNGSQL